MTATFHASGNGGQDTGLSSFTVTCTITAGDSIVIYAGWDSASTTTPTVATAGGTGSDAFTLVYGPVNDLNTDKIGVWLLQSAGTGRTGVTVSWASSNPAFAAGFAVSFTGLVAPTLDQFVVGGANANTGNTPTLTSADEIAFQLGLSSVAIASVNAPWTGDGPASGIENLTNWGGGHRILAATTPIASNFTNSSGNWQAYVWTFKAASTTVSVEDSKSKTIFIPRQGPTKGLRQTQAFAPAVILPDYQIGARSKTIFIPGRGPRSGLKRYEAYPDSIASATGAGSAAGVGTATAVGASTAAAIGAAAGIGSATGVGASTAAAVGNASGTGAATAVGASTAASVGSAAGIGAATSVGASTAAAVGSAAGTGAATGPDVSTAASVGASAGIGAATAIGASTAAAVGSAAGTGAATGIAPVVLDAQVGMSQGFLFHPGRGPTWDLIKRSAFPADVIGGSFGVAAGVGSATAVGASTAASVGVAAGTGAATAPDASTAASIGSAAGIGSATAVGASTAAAVGSAAGTGADTAIGAPTAAASGSSAGVGAAAAVGASTAAAVGNATGVGAATGASAVTGTTTGVGLAQGVGTTTAVGSSIAAAVGVATGIGSATATSGSGTPNYGTNHKKGGSGKFKGWRPLKKKKLTELEELDELEELLKVTPQRSPVIFQRSPKVYQGPLAAIFYEPIEPRTTPTVRAIMAKAAAQDDEEALLQLLEADRVELVQELKELLMLMES